MKIKWYKGDQVIVLTHDKNRKILHIKSMNTKEPNAGWQYMKYNSPEFNKVIDRLDLIVRASKREDTRK